MHIYSPRPGRGRLEQATGNLLQSDDAGVPDCRPLPQRPHRKTRTCLATASLGTPRTRTPSNPPLWLHQISIGLGFPSHTATPRVGPAWLPRRHMHAFTMMHILLTMRNPTDTSRLRCAICKCPKELTAESLSAEPHSTHPALLCPGGTLLLGNCRLPLLVLHSECTRVYWNPVTCATGSRRSKPRSPAAATLMPAHRATHKWRCWPSRSVHSRLGPWTN